MTPRFLQGDLTQPEALGLTGPFSLLLDIGCLHGLSDVQRDVYIAGMSTLAAPGAIWLLLAFTPGWRGPFPRGIAPEEVRCRFESAWTLAEYHCVAPESLPLLPRLAGLTAYTLRRRA